MKRKDKEEALEVKGLQLKSFLTVSGLSHLYCDQFKCNVPSTTTTGRGHALEYRGLWIFVGDKSVVYDDGHSTNNPSAQFEVFKIRQD